MRTQLRRRSISDFPHTPLAAALAAALAPQAAQALNIVVNNTADASYYQDPTFGTTLRGAVDYLNSNCSSGGGDVITFFHPNGNTPFVISGSNEIDVYCGGLTIDGGGSMTNSLTVIQAYGGYALWSGASTNVKFKGLDISGDTNGTALGGLFDADNNILHSNGTGIFVAYGGTSITNNTIFSNQFDAIDIEASPNATISGNVIGLDTNGNWSPNGSGIFGNSSHLTIDSNVISANNGDAIDLETDNASTITRNKIGTDASGTVALGNEEGIYLWHASGTTINNGNVISSSYGAAIFIDVGSSGITVDGNAIGTDPTRNQDISNENGITAFCSSGIQITNNAIASWSDYGIQFNGITGGGSMDIVNNAINVAGDGVTALGGSSYGVMLNSDICTSSLATPGKRLGKRAGKVAVRTKSAPAGATTNVMIRNNNISNASFDGIWINGGYNTTITGNTIQNNGGYGVDIFSGTGNSIVDNPKIYGNGSQTPFVKNINLDFPGGVYTSGPDSSHANNGQNPPTVTGAVVNYSNGQTTVHFTLTAPPGSYEVQVCDNPVATPGCNNLDGSSTVTVPAAGSVSGALAFFGIASDNFSATATSSGNDTSEFSSVFTITPAPNVTYSPASKSIDFGNVAVNGSSPPMAITLTSSGSTPYTLNNIGSPSCGSGPICYGGAFTCTTTCVPGNSYNPGGGCNITATFNPTALTTYSQTIGICDDSPSYGGTITLTGMGVTPPPVAINPASFDFGQQGVGTASNPQTFTIVNGGTSSVLLGEPSVDDPNFVILSNGCGSSLAASASCPVVAEFLPQSGGSLHATLSMPAGGSLGSLQIKHHSKAALVAGPGPGTAATAALTGTGVAQGAITLPSSIDLGAYSVGSPPDQRGFTITNNGTAPVNFSGIAVTAGNFQVLNGCPDSLAPGASCVVTLQYSASDLGTHTGTLTVNSDAEGGSRAIALTGVTVPSPVPILTVAPTQIGFGDRLLGSTSGTQRITITNVGNAPAALGLGMSNTDFLISFTSCAATLAPAASCYADVVLRPVGFGPRNGSLIVTSNSSASPQGVGLSGSGCRPYSTGSSRLGSSFGCSP